VASIYFDKIGVYSLDEQADSPIVLSLVRRHVMMGSNIDKASQEIMAWIGSHLHVGYKMQSYAQFVSTRTEQEMHDFKM
jgi:uncharacterized Fe-S radical SAM superfamily protein PflX